MRIDVLGSYIRTSFGLSQKCWVFRVTPLVRASHSSGRRNARDKKERENRVQVQRVTSEGTSHGIYIAFETVLLALGGGGGDSIGMYWLAIGIPPQSAKGLKQ